MDLSYIIAPLLGGVIGYITNDIAIRMLFRPHTAKFLNLVRQNLPDHLKGLKMDAVYEIEDEEIEIKLSPLPSYDYSDDCVIHTDFCGEYYISFYIEDKHGNRKVIAGYDYIDK